MTNLSKEEQRNKVESLLEEFGLKAIRKSRGDLLSGGEQTKYFNHLPIISNSMLTISPALSCLKEVFS